MNATDKQHAAALQEALLALTPSGPLGFEGFLGLILGEVTAQPYRLAKSGTQQGRDGDSAFDGGCTYFEGKRYRDGLSKNDINVKLFDVANDDSGLVDMWILGATCEVASQITQDAQRFAAKHGFGFVVLDWSNNDLGALLICTVIAGEKSKDFIVQSLGGGPDAHLVAPAISSIKHFSNHADLSSRTISLMKSLAEDTGLGHCKRQNRMWLNRLFESKMEARAELGQPLSPLDTSGATALDRPERSLLARAYSGEPTGDIYAIVGEEGVGKSWLAVQSWCHAEPQPLLVFCPADELIRTGTDDLDDFLIRKIINQSGGTATSQSMTRWQRRFKSWGARVPPSSVRLTLIVDGLNQPLAADWPRWLDRTARHLRKLGGSLVVTTRDQHWSQLKTSLASKVMKVSVPQWTIEQVKQILSGQGIDFYNTRAEVLESVRNPRMLGIAVELIEGKSITLLEELSIGRLLFEHMRRTQQLGTTAMSATAFAELLMDLATRSLDKAKAQGTDDLRLIDSVQEARLELVASCRFFSRVKGRYSQYEINAEGLNLALALYLISQLEREVRNKRDPRDRMASILEPISALDETAKVVFLATQIACLDDDCSSEVCSGLIEQFVSLQNLPNAEFDAFSILAKSAPVAFLQAAEKSYLSQDHVAGKDWLLLSLLIHREAPSVLQCILQSAGKWLSFYSLEPERRMFATRSHSTEEIEAERTRLRKEIDEVESRLTAEERSFISTNLVPAPTPLFDGACRLAMHLLAGLPLAQVASHLVRWRFSYALNASVSSPYAEFEQLLHYNRSDWQAARSALHQELSSLPACLSNVGRWTQAGVLFGTGDIQDAQEGSYIVDELTIDREKFEGWSIRDSYCSVDPCDPSSVRPDDVVKTAERYRTLDPDQLACGRSGGESGHFFRGARAAVARFAPDAGAYMHNALAISVNRLNLQPTHHGVWQLLHHSSSLRRDIALRFLSAAKSSRASSNKANDPGNEFIAAQFSLLIALPHLNASEQFDAIGEMQTNTLLLDAVTCIQRVDADTAERSLERAIQVGNENALASVLAALHYSQSPLSPRSSAIVRGLIGSPRSDVRQEALALAARGDDADLLREVVASGWRASTQPTSSYESWHGSSSLVGAMQVGLISAECAIDRMSFSHYGYAAAALPAEKIALVSHRIDEALRRALGFKNELELPDIEVRESRGSETSPPLITLAERPSAGENFLSEMERLSETDEEISDRQRRLGDAYDLFSRELTSAKAHLILSDISTEGLKAILGSDGDLGRRWMKRLISAPDSELRNIRYFALQLATVLGGDGDRLTIDLIHRILRLSPVIRRVSGVSKVPLEAIILWDNATSSSIIEICRMRLRSVRTDSDIAHEVLAAHVCGKVGLLQMLTDELLEAEQPYETALALMISGFSDEDSHAELVLSRFDGSKGFIGHAHTAAREAYARNAWAKTWYGRMLAASQPLEFWSASVQFMKIVDGRFDTWQVAPGAGSEVFGSFMPTIEGEVSNRAIKVHKARGGKLFGEKAPTPLMLMAE